MMIPETDPINVMSEDALASRLFDDGETLYATSVAHAIVSERPVTSTADLTDLVTAVIPRRSWPREVRVGTYTVRIRTARARRQTLFVDE